MTEIKRWTWEPWKADGDSPMYICANGEYIKHSDHAAKIKELEEKLQLATVMCEESVSHHTKAVEDDLFKKLVECVEELIEVLDDENYEHDSFTTQPVRELLERISKETQ